MSGSDGSASGRHWATIHENQNGLWPSMRFALRKRSMGWAASATTAAYVLCQFSFFMLFALILSWGKNNEIGTLFMGLLIMIDYHQLFDIG